MENLERNVCLFIYFKCTITNLCWFSRLRKAKLAFFFLNFTFLRYFKRKCSAAGRSALSGGRAGVLSHFRALPLLRSFSYLFSVEYREIETFRFGLVCGGEHFGFHRNSEASHSHTKILELGLQLVGIAHKLEHEVRLRSSFCR